MPPPENSAPTPGADDIHPQYYAAASARGIEEELLALVADQLAFLKRLHALGSLAPLAATMNTRGEIEGSAVTTPGEPGPAADAGPGGAIAFFREQHGKAAHAGTIVASAVFFHGCHGPGKGALSVAVAQNVSDADCLIALLDHRDGQAVACVIQYRQGAGGTWLYDPAYYVLNARSIFVDAEGKAAEPNEAKDARFPRRPAASGDRGVHPESMTLLEAKADLLTSLHASGSLAPVAAWMKPSGEIQAGMLLAPDAWAKFGGQTDFSDSIVMFPQTEREATPVGAVAFFVQHLRAMAERGEIVASGIFYYARFDTDLAPLGLMPALVGEEPDCLVAQLDHRLSQAMSVVMRYTITPDGRCQYAPTLGFPNYPLIFNESGGPYAEHVAMKLAEALRALVAVDAPAAPEWWSKRLRPLVPETPLGRAELDPILEPMTMPEKIAVLRQLADLGRPEVGPIAAELSTTANELEKELLGRVILRCSGPAGN